MRGNEEQAHSGVYMSHLKLAGKFQDIGKGKSEFNSSWDSFCERGIRA